MRRLSSAISYSSSLSHVDFNEEPSGADILVAFRALGGAAIFTHAPTRWNSSRCVDWAATCSPMFVKGPELLAVAISDHIPLRFELSSNFERAIRGSLRFAPKLGKPQGVASDIWRAELEQKCWLQHESLVDLSSLCHHHVIHVQEEWDLFQKILEDTVRATLVNLSASPHLDPETRQTCLGLAGQNGSKGGLATFQRSCVDNGLRQEVGNLQVRKQRHWLARVYEARRILRGFQLAFLSSKDWTGRVCKLNLFESLALFPLFAP